MKWDKRLSSEWHSETFLVPNSKSKLNLISWRWQWKKNKIITAGNLNVNGAQNKLRLKMIFYPKSHLPFMWGTMCIEFFCCLNLTTPQRKYLWDHLFFCLCIIFFQSSSHPKTLSSTVDLNWIYGPFVKLQMIFNDDLSFSLFC